MTWNYRIFREENKTKQKFLGHYYTIRSVYYDDDGHPHSCSETFASANGEDLNELRIDLCRMMEAIAKPILLLRDNKIVIDPAGK